MAFGTTALIVRYAFTPTQNQAVWVGASTDLFLFSMLTLPIRILALDLDFWLGTGSGDTTPPQSQFRA